MKLLKRATIFAAYPLIGALIREFQTLGFDPDEDNSADGKYDAMQLSEVNIDFANHILMVPHKDIVTYPRRVAEALHELLIHLQSSRLFLLSSIKCDLFGDRRHRSKELDRVREQLQLMTDQFSFMESMMVNVEELEQLVDVFFWLGRQDPSLPEYVFWVDVDQRHCFFICKYGNIHLLSLCGRGLIGEDELRKLGFVVGEDHDQFA